jgi:hypothetical protein
VQSSAGVWRPLQRAACGVIQALQQGVIGHIKCGRPLFEQRLDVLRAARLGVVLGVRQ